MTKIVYVVLPSHKHTNSTRLVMKVLVQRGLTCCAITLDFFRRRIVGTAARYSSLAIVDSLPTLVIMFLIFVNQLAIWHLYAARPTGVGKWNDSRTKMMGKTEQLEDQ